MSLKLKTTPTFGSRFSWLLLLSIFFFRTISPILGDDIGEGDIAQVENIKITYTERDEGVDVEWFGLTLFETPSPLSDSAVEAVLRGVSQYAQDELFKIYDGTGYDLHFVSIGNVTEVELVRQQSSRRLKRIFELDNHASSRDTEEEETLTMKTNIRQVPSSNAIIEDEEYMKKTRQIQEEVYGSYFILGGNVTFLQLPTPIPEEVNSHLSTILDNLDQMLMYIQMQNHPELSRVNSLVVQKNLPSLSPSIAPSLNPTSAPSPNPTPITPPPTFSPTVTPTTSPVPTSSPPVPTSTPPAPTSTPLSPPSVPNTQSANPSGAPNMNSVVPDPISPINPLKTVEPSSDGGSSTSIPLIATVASVSAAFLVLTSAFLVRQRHLEKYPKMERYVRRDSHDNSEDDMMVLKDPTKLNDKSFSDMSSGNAKIHNTFDSGSSAGNPHLEPTPKASGSIRNYHQEQLHGTGYFTAYGGGGSINDSFTNSSAGIQLKEAEMNYYKNQSEEKVEMSSLEKGYYTPPVSGPTSPASETGPKEKADSNMVGIATKGDTIEVAAVPFDAKASPNVLANWGTWLFGAKQLSKSQQNQSEEGAFPSSRVEEDNFETEFEDEDPRKTRSKFSKKIDPKSPVSSQDSPASLHTVDGSFPTFNVDEESPPQKTSRNLGKSPANSASREDNSLSYNSQGLHPLDWSYRESEDESTLTEHDKKYLQPIRTNAPKQQMIQNLPVTPQSLDSSYYSLQSEVESEDASNASSSKQLINDLVWLENKISDVKSRVNRLDGEEASMNSSVSQSSSPSDLKSPISHSIICRDCFAPPGRLQIVIHSTKDGPAVHSVKPGSALEGKLFPGDLILAVDDLDTRTYSAEEVMKMMAAKSAFERKITVLHFDDRSFQL